MSAVFNKVSSVWLTTVIDGKNDNVEIVAPTPSKIDTTYDGNGQWIDNTTIQSKNSWTTDEAWTAKDDSNNLKYLEVKKIKYTDTEGTETDLGTDTSKIVDAGTYSVTVAMKNIRWKGGTTGEKTFLINVAQKDVGTLTPKVDYGKEDDGVTTKKYYSGTSTSGFPAISLPDGWTITGELEWDDKQTLGTTGNYNWTFTPDDKNYAVKKSASPITVTQVAVNSISAEYTGTAEIFTSTIPSSLLDNMTLTKTYNNSTEPVSADASEFEIVESTLAAGKDKEITVRLKANKNITCKVTLPEVLAVVPSELDVKLKEGSTVYASTSLDDLKTMLTVKEINNDGTDGETLAADQFDFPENFSLTSGTNTVTVTHKHTTDDGDIEVTGDVTISVGVAGIKSVKVTPNVPEGTTLWEGAAANTIKEYLTVEVVFSDGNDTKKTLDPKKDNFTINIIGSEDNVLTAGQCAFTVTYGGKTSSAQTVTVTERLVETLTATYVQAGRTIYSSATEDDLQIDTYLSVNAVFNNDDEETLESSEYTVSIPKNFSSINNTITVTWTKGQTTKTTTFTVTVTDVAISGVEAEFELPAGKKITAANGLDDLKEYVTATLKYNNGDEKTLKAADYTLEAEESELQESGNLKAGERTITLKYDDDTTTTFTVTVEKATVEMGGATFTPTGGDGGNNGDLKPSTGGNGGFSGTYKPDGEFGIGIDPEDLPDGVTPKEPVYKKWTGKGEPTYDTEGKPTGSGWTSLPAGTKPTGAGTYVAEIDFDYDDDNFEPIDPVSTIIDIGKADVDMGGTAFAPAGGSESGLKPSDNGGYAGTYTDGGNYGIDIDPKTLPDGVTAGTPVYKKLKDGGDPDNEADWTVVTKPDGAGTYKVVVELTSDDPDNYNDIDPIETVLVLSEAKKGLDLPTVEDIVFSNALVSIADKLGGSYIEHKDIITLGGVYDGVKNAGVYTATLTLTDDNYYWNESAGTGVQTNGKKVLFAGGTFAVNGQVATLTWRILPFVLTAENWALTGKEGAVYNLPAALTEGLDVGVNYRYFEDKTSEALEDGAALSEGAQYFVKAELFGTDAYNFVFEGTLTSTSDFANYTVPAGFLTTAVNFLKANWIWLVIGAVVLIALILAIVLGARSAKKKRIREERRLAEEKAERERKEEERERKEEERRQREEERRREEREERMMRMSQPQMPQMQMAQPQYMPQAMPQMMPQTAQPMSMGGGDNAQMTRIENELAALRAEQAAKDLSVLRMEQQLAQAHNDLQFEKLKGEMRNGGEQVVQGGISLDKLTELIRTEVNNAFNSREKAAVQNATATPESGAANATATQVPPDAVMTTVTTTKIDTTKKPAQGNAQATARPIVRSYVAPMPVDDGRVFDVGGFYKPADPVDLEGDDEENKK